MFRFICSIVSIASVLGVLMVGCGSDTSANPIVGKGGTGAPVTKGSGGAKAGSAGSGAPKGLQGGSTAAGGNLAVGGSTAEAGRSADDGPRCGDGIKNREEEECDGEDIGDKTCESLAEGTTGKPGCTEECLIDTNVCTPVPVIDSGNVDGDVSYGG
jgi:hypothetical protein